MSPRALIIHIVACVLAVGFAWRMAHRVVEKQGGPSSRILLDAAKGDVVSVEYKWKRGSSKVTSSGSDKERIVVVDLAREIEPPKDKDKDKAKEKEKDKSKKDDARGDAGPEATDPDAGVADAPADVPVEKKREEARFPAGKTVMNGIEALEPLKTRRTLGKVDAARLKAMGLDAPERFLVVTTKSGRKIELELGESSYGAQGRYARVKGEDDVHLLESAVATAFEGAADTMMEKKPLALGVEDIAGYDVRFGDKQGAYVHKDREQSAKRKFVPKEDLSSTADEPGKLMTTLRNLRGSKLVADEGVVGSAVASFKVEVVDRKEPIVIELHERIDGNGHVVRATYAKGVAWSWEVTETQGKELLEDLEALLP